MTLKELALRYEVDVVTRIQTLEEEKADIKALGNHDDHLFRDYDDQIAHWKATLADILSLIEKERFR